MSTPPYDPNQQYPESGGPYGPPGYQQPGYQQPGYQQPGYQQPGYGPGYPPSYGYPVAPPSATTNTMAILALVMAFVFPPLGIVFGYMGRAQIRERGEGGEALATAGLIIGYVGTALYIIGCAIWLTGFVYVAHRAGAVPVLPLR
jgi:hypothetical protein